MTRDWGSALVAWDRFTPRATEGVSLWLELQYSCLKCQMWLPWCTYFMWQLIWKLWDCPDWRKRQENRLLSQELPAAFLRLSTPLQWSRETLRQLFLLGLHVTPLLAPALALWHLIPVLDHSALLEVTLNSGAAGATSCWMQPLVLCRSSCALPLDLSESRNWFCILHLLRMG